MCASMRDSSWWKIGRSQVVLDLLERRFDLGELDVKAPQPLGRLGGEVGAQHVASFAAADAAQRGPIEPELEAGRGRVLRLLGQHDLDGRAHAPGILAHRAELHQQLVARERVALQRLEPLHVRADPPPGNGQSLHSDPAAADCVARQRVTALLPRNSQVIRCEWRKAGQLHAAARFSVAK
jgi:hypothetical protein